MVVNCASYLRVLIDTETREQHQRKVAARVRRRFPRAASIVCTGVSGLLIGPAVATLLKLPLVVVRRKGDPSHSSRPCEGDRVDPYVIVDDLTASGATIARICDALGDPTGRHCVGVVTLGNGNSNGWDYLTALPKRFAKRKLVSCEVPLI